MPLPSPLGTTLVDGVGADKASQLLAKELNGAWILGSTSSGAKGPSDLWLVKLSAAGAVAGEVLVGAEGEETAAAAVNTSGGGALAVGSVKPGPLGGQDAFLVRFGADATVVWKQVAGETGDDAALAVALFGKDEAWVAGSSQQKGVTLPWVARVSAVGTVLWQKPLAGAAGVARAVVAVPGGGAWLAGERLDPAGKPVWWAARLAADGKVQWEGVLSALTGSANAAVPLADGGAVLAGWQGAGFEDARAARVDAAGKILWDKLFGGAGGAWFGQLTPAEAQTVRFAGQREVDGLWHAWVGAVDSGGQPVWDRVSAQATGGTAVTSAVLTSGYLTLATGWSDAATKGAAVRVVRADPWGYATCDAQGDCAGKTAPDCDDANPCTNDSCFALLGCSHQLNGLACDDGNPCTENDACAAGQCGGDGQGSCDDSNPCTQDLCSASGGCSHTPVTGSCSDGNFCTVKDQCVGGFCKPGLIDSCDDANACSDDTCLPSKGCQHLPNGSDCQSGNCTYADVCIKGACVSSGKAGFVDQWIGTAVAERPRKLAQIGQEGFWLVGDTYELSTADGYLVRADANGAALSKTVVKPSFVNTVGADYLTGVVATSFGAMIAGGTSSCQQRGWILRVDPTGKEVWSKPYSHDNANYCTPGANTGFFYDIADGQDGSWAAVGWRHGYPWSNDVLQAWVVRVDKDGAMLTNNLYHKGAAIFYGVAPMAGMGYAAVGATDETTAGGWDGLVSRLAPNGSALWHKKLGGTGSDYLVEADAAPDGGVYAAGRSASGGAGNDDGWVVRLDVAGNLLWQRSYGGGQNDGFNALSVLPGGTVVVAGYTYSKGKGGADLWLVGLDPAGNVQWERLQGAASDDVITALAPLVGSGLAVAAYGTPPKASAHDFRLLVVDNFGHFSCTEAGSCFGKALLDCDDGEGCTADDCNAASGCTASAAAWACSDGDACTGGDVCKSGVCIKGGSVVCDDKNPCTKDACDSAKGCIADPLANGTSCGTGKTCAAGICK